ncbi:MAG: serine hydrolase [Bacteroidota bacterium]
MIAYSDNYATDLLHEIVDMNEYKKTYEHIGIAYPDVTSKDYFITPKEYSSFFKVLYNSGYLSLSHSELAVELLSKCDFDKGFTAGFPKGTHIAHKFGEWGDGKKTHELHESGFIYLNGTAYLLVIMTKGNDLQKLTEVISYLSKVVYDNVEDPNIKDSDFTS